MIETQDISHVKDRLRASQTADRLHLTTLIFSHDQQSLGGPIRIRAIFREVLEA